MCDLLELCPRYLIVVPKAPAAVPNHFAFCPGTRAVTKTIHTIDASRALPRRRRWSRLCASCRNSVLPFLLAGTYALRAYTGITRATKDLDILCKPSDYPRILDRFKTLGYAIEIEDERWLAKIFRGEHFFDVIFASLHGGMPVSDQWFEHAPRVEVFGIPANVIASTELIWSRSLSRALCY
jgi:hypothetical protein